jgi:hypothetical protein
VSDSRPETLEHIGKVDFRIYEIRQELAMRALHHDASKLEEPEKSGYDALVGNLAGLEYPSDEYRAALRAAKPTIDHHYLVNDHHPEHHPNGLNDMSLLSIAEMLADWKAASERTKDGSLAKSLPHNKKRFKFSDQLYLVVVNTARELNWITEEEYIIIMSENKSKQATKQVPSIGRAVHYVLPDGPEGDNHRSATIVRVWSGGMVNLQVLLDSGPNGNGNDKGYTSSLVWKTSIHQDEDEKLPNTWHFPEYVAPVPAE